MPPRARPALNLHDLAVMLWVPLGMAGIMSVVAVLLGEPRFAAGFVVMGAATALVRWPLSRHGDTTGRRFSGGETMATAALGWAMIGALAAIPFWLSPWLADPRYDVGAFESPLNGLFEAVSGITSTGLTMVSRPSQLPPSLQLWRSFSEWIGGVGIALLMITLLNPKSDASDLFNAELNKNFADDARNTARWIWRIYLALTVLAIATFLILGMPPWEALNHGLTGIATGGFSVTDGSFDAYSRVLQNAAIVVMMAGAISFAAYRLALQRRNPLALVEQGPSVALLSGVAVATALVWLSRLEFETDGGLHAALFQSVSAFATAGFSTIDFSDWHSAPLAILVACMLIGGASGATTGGVKIDRILLLARGVTWRLQRQFGMAPTAVTIDGERYRAEDARLLVEAAATLVALWILTALLGCLALAATVGDEWAFTQVVFEVMSALGSVGLSTGITTAELSAVGKWTLILLMWAGRLELFALLALLWLPVAQVARSRLE